AVCGFARLNAPIPCVRSCRNADERNKWLRCLAGSCNRATDDVAAIAAITNVYARDLATARDRYLRCGLTGSRWMKGRNEAMIRRKPLRGEKTASVNDVSPRRQTVQAIDAAIIGHARAGGVVSPKRNAFRVAHFCRADMSAYHRLAFGVCHSAGDHP